MKRVLFVMFALVLMSSFAYGQSNESTVSQVGDGNYATVTQSGNSNEANVTQYGTNTSLVNQSGEDNDATVTMGEDGSPVNNSDTPSWRYGAFIDQIGQENKAGINIHKGDGTYQSGGNSNGARIEQYGNRNQAFQDISNSQVKTTNWDRMGAHIKQLGDDNFGQQQVFRSFGTHGSGGILIDQNGNENQALQYVIGGRSNVTEIFQYGDGNKYTGFQSQIADILDLPWALKPAGDFAQYQRGEYSTVRIDVLGDDNITAQYQEGTTWGGGYNTAEIDIIGNENQAAQAQLGINNVAGITITGSWNKAGVQQLGDYHSGVISQTGDSNNAIITQSN
jgi:hypothetical protein